MSGCRLYLISPPRLAVQDFSGVLKDALKGGDVASFQLRLKHASDDEIRRACDTLRPIVQAAGAAFILNDRPDLAAELGCDGVHVGQEDATYAEARAAVGRQAIVGVTCHNSRHLAMEAGEAGADYVAFGAFFPTATKEAKTEANIELLEWWAQAMVVPVVAIGGITVKNAPALVAAGADFLAVASGVWEYDNGPEAAVRDFNALFFGMTEKLLSFLFLGILVAMSYHLGIGLIYGRYFATSVLFQTYWYIPLVAVPALLLAGIAWWIGFFRGRGGRVVDAAALLILAAIVILTVPASYSCQLGCF